METYGALRSFADSWGLLLLVIAFVAVLVWVFRPGARKAQDEAAKQIFRYEDAPKPDAPKEDAPKKDEDDGR
jgi:cytochrome c oxidase cbb3-type subunit IV